MEKNIETLDHVFEETNNTFDHSQEKIEEDKNALNIPLLRFKSFQSEWDEFQIKDLLNFYSTNSFSRSKLNSNSGIVQNIHYGDIHTKFSVIVDCQKIKIPYINPDVDLKKITKESYCKNGDLIIADASENYEDIGKSIELININDKKIISGLHTLLARDKNQRMYLGFKGYLFQTESIKKQLKTIANGISVLGISKKNVSNIQINIPSKEEQEKIVKFLSFIDRKIMLLEKINRKYLKIKKYYSNQFFYHKLNFDSSNIKNKENKLNDLLTVQGGYSFDSKQFNTIKKGNKIIKIGDIKRNIYLSNIKNYSIEHCNEKYIVKDGDFIIALSGATFGKTGLIRGNDNAYINQRITKFDCNHCNYLYIYYLINSVIFQSYLHRIPTASAQPNISNKDILNFKFKFPEINEQKKIGQFLYLIDKKITLFDKKIKEMKKYKHSLLQQMFI